ncbi:MAG: glycoside hydrolase family 65 protein, partial [Bacillota bacterium]|nr:glycoside hydrolase family 65 protein [Bacillota bacterium]
MKNYIIEESKLPQNESHHETLFSIGNGFVGFRGSFFEKESKTQGCFINNFYEEHTMEYGEKLYGFPDITESMINIPDPRNITFYVDGEKCDFSEEYIKDFKKKLNLKKGILETNFIYKKNGKEVKVKSTALVSFNNKNLSFIKYEVTPINFDGNIEVISFLNNKSSALDEKDDPRVANIKNETFEIKEKILNNNIYGYKFITFKTKKELTVLEEIVVDNGDFISAEIFEDNVFKQKLVFNAKAEETISVIKINEIYLDEDIKQYLGEEKTFEFQLKKQGEYLDSFWESSGISIDNNDELTQGIRFNLFHLLQSVNKEGITGMAAKGLTGEGYEGHNFWDTEIFIFPFFLFTDTEIAKKLLIYRYSTIQEGKKRAKELGCNKGVKFPWRTISGKECSGYYPAGTAQYHINADIAYAVDMYYKVTDDKEFMKDYGVEILVETARFFLEVGYFNKKNEFRIDGVTGPDEYTAIVNNNYYTNKMVKRNFESAYKYIKKFKYKNIDKKEIKLFKKAYKNMYLPFNKKLKVIPQDDTFLNKERWDFENTKEEDYPLLLNYHPLKLYRHQVCKQADVCLADFLVGDDVSRKIKKNNYDYYIDITTHDSSLSYNTYSVIACEIGYLKEAYSLYTKNVRLDIDNSHNNSNHGIHTAAMGGSWLGLVYGFGGMRINNKGLFFSPKTISELGSYSFIIKYKKGTLKVSVSLDNIKYELIKGKKIIFYSNTKKIK